MQQQGDSNLLEARVKRSALDTTLAEAAQGIACPPMTRMSTMVIIKCNNSVLQAGCIDRQRRPVDQRIKRHMISARSVLATADYDLGSLGRHRHSPHWSSTRNHHVIRSMKVSTRLDVLQSNPTAFCIYLKMPTVLGKVVAQRDVIGLRTSQGATDHILPLARSISPIRVILHQELGLIFCRVALTARIMAKGCQRRNSHRERPVCG